IGGVHPLDERHRIEDLLLFELPDVAGEFRNLRQQIGLRNVGPVAEELRGVRPERSLLPRASASAEDDAIELGMLRDVAGYRVELVGVRFVRRIGRRDRLPDVFGQEARDAALEGAELLPALIAERHPALERLAILLGLLRRQSLELIVVDD